MRNTAVDCELFEILKLTSPQQHRSSLHSRGQPNEGGVTAYPPVRQLLPACSATVFSIRLVDQTYG